MSISNPNPNNLPISAASSGSAASISNKSKLMLKVIILGNSGVGKSSLLSRFVSDTYNENYKSTIGTDMHSKTVEIYGDTVTLQLWDTAGSERFNSLTDQFHRGSNMCLLVFDLTDSQSFDSLGLWRDQFLSSTGADESFPFAVIGNKLDEQNNRTVSQRRAIAWCNYISSNSSDNNTVIPYYETSAKDSTNVTLAFMEMARKAYKQQKAINTAIQQTLLFNPNNNTINQNQNNQNNNNNNIAQLPTAKPINLNNANQQQQQQQQKQNSDCC